MQIGPYRILDELGRGGMGVVYRAQDAAGRAVALKALLPHRAAQPRVRQRFLRELHTLSKLKHPHLVPLLGAGEHEGTPWLALEFVEGPTLEDRLRQGPLPVANAQRLVAQLASGLAYLHDCGVVHRDLKPANVLLRGGDALLTDFGLVLDGAELEGSRLTGTGVFLGTPGFWAPEQAQGDTRAQGAHTDLYGLGALLYACLTGRAPVVADSLADYLQTQLFRRIEAPHRVRSEVPPWLSELCMECLDPEPSRRPASAEEVARRLHQGAAPEPAPARSTRAWGVAALTLVLVAAVGAGWALTRGGGDVAPDANAANATDATDPRPTDVNGDSPPDAGDTPLAPPEPPTSEELARIEAARAKLLARDVQGALRDFEPIVARRPNDPAVRFDLGICQSVLGREREALATFDRVLELDPDFTRAYTARGQVHLELHDYARAVVDLTQAFRRAPSSLVVLRLRSQAYYAAGDLENARKEINRCAGAGEDPAELAPRLAQLLTDLGHYEEALRVCDRMLRDLPGDASFLGLRRRNCSALGDGEGVREAVERLARARVPPDFLWFHMTQACRTADDYRSTLASFDTMLAENASLPLWLHSLRATCLLHLGEWEAAAEGYAEACRQKANAEDLADALIRYALAKALLGDLPAAREGAERALGLLADHPNAYQAALWLAGLGEPNGLERIPPGSMPPGIRALVTQLQAGGPLRPDAVLSVCQGPLQRGEAAAFLGLAYERRDDLDAARSHYRIAAEVADRSAVALEWAGIRLAQLERE